MASRPSFSRSLIFAVRSSAFRSSSPIIREPLRLRQPSASAPRRLSFSNPRTLGELGCTQSLMPFHRVGARLNSHLAANLRSFCELSHGTFYRSCQDR
ncbi:hypothetical protein M569_16125 [Genlisea aurea]|uniref:Uncharacterized protein n=1 Tax=Genlisea aurea TaxID=192259 RepID=S8DH27_9LAMI|nr:hypothetical protein M569_16125 [Genlisea aurea]